MKRPGLWLAVQGAMIGFRWPIQYITLVNGLLILLVAIIPDVNKYYSEV